MELETARTASAPPPPASPSAAALQRSEEALRRSEQRYRSLVQVTSQIVWVTNAEGAIEETCPSWELFTGQTFDEYRGLGWLDAIHPQDRDHIRDVWLRAVKNQKLYEVEYRLRYHTGEWRNVLTRGSPVLAQDGKVREWIGICTDITDRARVQEALREEIRLTDTLHSIGMALAAELDLQKLVQMVTEAATQVTRAQFGAFFLSGQEAGALSGARRDEFERFPTPAEIFDHALRGEGILRIPDATKEARFAAGSPFVLARGHSPVRSYLIVPVYTRSVQMLGALLFGHAQPGVFTARDERLAAGIAAQAAVALDNARLYREAQETQKRLARQLDLTRAITDSLAEGIYAVDREGRATFVNPATQTMLGYTAEELIGRDLHELVHFQHADGSAFPKEQCPLLAVLKTGTTCHAHDDLFIRKDGGTFPVAYSSAPTLEDGEVVGAVVSFHDITQRKWAEEALRRSKEELERLVDERTAELRETNVALERSNRELQDFASVASHDLQEPLRKIQAFGDRLVAKVGTSLGPEAADYLQRMQKAAGRMQTLINDLLAFARVTTKAQPFVAVDLGQVIGEVLTDLETAVEKSGGEVDVGPLPQVEADPTQMRQLFQNLVANALKFRRPGVPPVVRVSAAVDEATNSCQITVADNGIGFDEKYLDRIFNVFQRLHNRTQYEGTGIGLAVCRKIAERHGGSVTAHSKPHEGSRFVVTLPVRRG